MKCRRAEELFSDYLEGTLAPPLGKDIEEHLATCAECPPLLGAFRQVMETLGGLERPAPAPELVERIVAATSKKPVSPFTKRMRRLQPFTAPALRPWAALAAAALLVVVIGTTDLPGPLGSLGRQVNRFGSQAYSFGLRVYHGTDRLFDELDLLRMTVGVAFEDRLDRLNERLRDLQKAQQKSERKQNPASDKGSSLLLMSTLRKISERSEPGRGAFSRSAAACRRSDWRRGWGPGAVRKDEPRAHYKLRS